MIVKKCKGIFTVSNTVKNEICAYYKISDDFVHVIPNALNNTNIISNDIDDGYLLVVGAAYPHKNIHELLYCSQYWENNWNLKIVSARGDYAEFIKNIIKERKLENKVELKGFVSESELQSLYRKCSALVYPSKYEGFGIPPMEALRYSKPIILSDIPVFREIFFNYAIFVNLGNMNSWKQAFKLLKHNNYYDDTKIEEMFVKYNWNDNRFLLFNIINQINV